jgi:predicted DNA binding CopG/RHH family protein
MKTQMKKRKPIPRFNNEDEERDFWATHSATDYFDFSRRVVMDFSHLKLSTKPMTIRLPSGMLSDLKTLANKRDVPYQSLLKIFLAERLQQEFRPGS